MKINHAFLAGAIASAVVSLGANALASDISTILAQPSATLVTLDSSPVVTAILSAYNASVKQLVAIAA